MSENKSGFGSVGLFLLACVFGALTTTAALAAAAAWMTSNACSGTAAQPLATAAMGAGSLCGGFAAAVFRKSRRLLYGIMLGCLLAALWGSVAAASGAVEESHLLLHGAVSVLCGGAGALAAGLRKKRR